jgi:signal transduction histidine kinase
MWGLPKRDLKIRLTLRIVAVSAICFAATSAYLLFDAAHSARSRMDEVAQLTARELTLQRSKMDWLRGSEVGFPDLQMIATTLMSPGMCIAYRTNSGATLQRFCSGVQASDSETPALFAVPYRSTFDLARTIASPVTFRGERLGDAVVWVDPTTLTAQAWHQGGRLIVVMALALPLLTVLIYTALVSLAESLGTALNERNELTRKLIALQDDERRNIARELHDELGQNLAAIRALAAAVSQTAQQDCPAILAECDSISRTATHMMEGLRGTLFRLRPPDVEELGLAASLEGLVAGWNGRSRGRTRFESRFKGEFEQLPVELAANLYRIAQEAITNASKHAQATRVVLELTMHTQQIALTVSDDGRPVERDPSVKSGMGFLGMRERVGALGGKLTFEASRPNGSTLNVVIPVAP